jgi:polyhydroxyalkanoate synthesis repressor PhaR
MSIMPVIKRYPNRKLYDTEAKRYITLDQITQLIQNGVEIQVIDHESGEDLTNLTLTQIILEQEKKSANGFVPRVLLTNLIRTSGDTLDHVRRSLPATLRGVAAHDDLSIPEQTGKALDQGRAMLEQAQALLRLDDRVADFLHLFNVPTKSDLQLLQDQIASLSAKLEQLLDEQRAERQPEHPTQPSADQHTPEV